LSNVANLTRGMLGKKWHCQERQILTRTKNSFTEEERNEGLWGSEGIPPAILNLDTKWK
jgi:hypothetical protein